MSDDLSFILQALAFAADKHRAQRRKGADAAPYINHPIDVANILCNEGGVMDPVVLAAALLHDTIEDTGATREELERLFGPDVARIVAEVSDDKSLQKAERKRLQIEHAAHISREAKLVKLADKISNLREIASNPPAGWHLERRREYFDWAKAVVDRMRRTHEALERIFDETCAFKPPDSGNARPVSDAAPVSVGRHESIVAELQKIEQSEDVRILYACESGSRAWGFPSKDSDYDVRFIYVHRPEWYLSLDEKRDVIEVPVHDDLDINGWELRKALKLFRKSNPPLLEWLESPIQYLERHGAARKMRNMAKEVFSPKACAHHYLHIAQGNFRQYLKDDLVRIKKFFYVLRPILACRWIEKFQTMPPMEFQKLTGFLPSSDGTLAEEVRKLLARKLAGDELDLEPRIGIINKFVESELARFESLLKTWIDKVPDNALLDALFRETLDDVWSDHH